MPTSKPNAKTLLERATTFQGLAVIAIALLGAGAGGVKWFSSKADAATVDDVVERVAKFETRVEIVEALQRAGFDQGRQTQEMVFEVLRELNRTAPPPRPIATPTPLPVSHPIPTSSP
jgi:NADH dehydrogenase FAD-containing subunit